MILSKCQCSGWTGVDTFGGCFGEGICDCTVKRHGDGDIEPPSDEGEAEFFAVFCSDLYAQATVDALAGFVDYVGVLLLLCEEAAWAFIAGWADMVVL